MRRRRSVGVGQPVVVAECRRDPQAVRRQLGECQRAPVGGAGASIRQFDLFGPSLREKREQAAPKPAETRKATAAASQTTNSESMHPRPPPATGAGNRRTFGRSAPPSWPTVCGGSSAQPSRAPAAARILASRAFAASNTADPPSTVERPTRRAPSNGTRTRRSPRRETVWSRARRAPARAAGRACPPRHSRPLWR